MAYTGNSRRLVALVIILAILSPACVRKQKAEHQPTAPDTFTFSSDEVPTLLSGVWYHTRDEHMNKPMEDEFSWGKTTFGYWNALLVDLLNGRQFVGVADGGSNMVTYTVDPLKKNLIHMHLGQSNGPGDEATIEVLSKDEIVFSFGDAKGGWYERVNGKYYKSFDPGRPESQR